MLSIIRKTLVGFIEDIDSGNSNITKEEQDRLIDVLNDIMDPKLSKYQACQYLNMSRAKFDKLVNEGVIKRGEKQVGFKELFWRRRDLQNITTKDN